MCQGCQDDFEKSANSSDSESVLMYIPNHLEDVKVRRGRGFASGKPLRPYRYDSRLGRRKGDHLENHLVTLFDVWR